ncbi:nitrogen regulation protein NR(II) [Pleionea sp. CnH1-48]|uniref:nitrogen regulation protein NR(II) n=1 Tax=Pleionea sp. CnH1-48 TaxID=2954494 RepID=UPI00209689A8|nr:nitrogen regulation protein NR(II) [Pleionea sp. CnH1-48]MCO7225224.1 nitrogen regulation protein NR(II) [Pleionea sp. CnH1-48]
MTPSPSLYPLLTTAVIVVTEKLEFYSINDAAEVLFAQSKRRIEGAKVADIIISDDLNSEFLQQCFEQKGRWYLEDASFTTTKSEWHPIRVNISYQLLDNQPVLILEIPAGKESRDLKREYQLIDQDRISHSLARNLAHEIKNPLSGLRGAAQLLERKLNDDNLKRFTSVIVAEADRLQKLVDRMLTPAKIEATQTINIHEVTEKAINFIELGQHQTLTIVRDYDPSLPELTIAPEQVYQALLNLMTNACESLDNRGQIIIRTRAAHQHTIGPRQFRLMARIDVEDNGPGISEDLKEVIFFPTISGKESSGLGLGIAQSLIRQHEGIIEFDSMPGKTCFSIYLPIIS